MILNKIRYKNKADYVDIDWDKGFEIVDNE